MKDVAAERIEAIEADFCAAASLAEEFRFDEAIVLLAGIARNDHPRLAKQSTRARQHIERLTVERKQLRTAAAEALTQAKQFFDAHDFDQAADQLDRVPAPMQNDDIRQLRAQVAERRQEISALTEELREAIREKNLIELPGRIERLLELKPDHAYAKTVAGQVQQRLVVAAKKLLVEHHYDRALSILDQISAWTDAADFRALHRQAAELACLDWDLRNAPVVDAALIAAASRLRRFAPKNDRVARLCQQLQARVQQAKDDPGRLPIAWAPRPKQTSLGVPVDWISGFRRIGCAETLDRSHLARHPGRFAVACGLALAGVQQAALRINLLANRQQGMLQRVAHLVRPRSSKSAWGIDLGSSSLKAVKLSWSDAKQQAIIEAAVVVEHSKKLGHAANEADETKVVAETLKKFQEMCEAKSERICVGLPGRMTLSRWIKTPPVDGAKAAKIISYEAGHQFPFPLKQLSWDFQILDEAATEPSAEAPSEKEKTRQAILIAAKSTTVDHFLDAFEQQGIEVDLLQTDFLALHNFLVHDFFGASAEVAQTVAALDIGEDVTNVVVSSPQSVWFRSLGVAGHSFTRLLVKEFNLSIAQAERRKCSPESSERFSDVDRLMSPVLEDLAKEIQQILGAYSGAHAQSPVGQVLILGGGAALHGLFRHLRCGR